MASLTELNPQTQTNLKLKNTASLLYAQSRHMMALNVAEVSHAGISFPIFISKSEGTGNYSLSALTSFVPGRNLFVNEPHWDSTFQSIEMQTYPFYLIRPKTDKAAPSLGFDTRSEALAENGDMALFDSSGKPSLWLSQRRAQLLEAAKNTVHTFDFLKTIDELNLIRAIDISVTGQDGAINRISGLHMINEDSLQKLPADTLTSLRDRGYLAPIYAMLFSALQLNALIGRHNKIKDLQPISRVNLEVAKTNRAL